MLGTITVVGIVVLAVLIWLFLRTRSQDLLTEAMEKRRGSCQLVSRASFAQGLDEIAVALCLSPDTLYYENADMQSSIELRNIDDVEYDDELSTGKSVPTGSRALRLRSHGTTFEFIMPAGETAKWQSALPARRIGGQPAARVG